MSNSQPGSAIGMIEVKGLSRGLLAANLASNAAAVTVDGVGYVHDGVVMVTLRGDVASVQTAVAAAVDALGGAAVVRATSVIPRPDSDVSRIVGQRTSIGAGRSFGSPGGFGGSRSRGRGFHRAGGTADAPDATDAALPVVTAMGPEATAAASKPTRDRRRPARAEGANATTGARSRQARSAESPLKPSTGKRSRSAGTSSPPGDVPSRPKKES